MCGIYGQYNFGSLKPVRSEEVKEATRTIAHRGPDDEGYFFSGPLGLGFRRLSIIDLAGGHQPMSRRRRDRLDRLQRRDLQLRGASRRARCAGTPVSNALRYRSDRPRLQGVGRGRLRSAERHVWPGDLGRPGTQARRRARRHGHQAGVLPSRCGLVVLCVRRSARW